MKKVLFMLAAALLSLSVAVASPIPCTVSGPTSISLGDAPGSGPNFTCGSLTFSNFEVVAAFGGATGVVDLYYNPGVTQPTYDSVTGEVDFSLNPNLEANQDIGLMFTVTGGISQVNLALSGVGASISELVCAAPIPTVGNSAYICPNGTFLGSVTDFSNDPVAPVLSGQFTTTSPVYIFKNIMTGDGGHLSAFTQSFETGVPEPVSLFLLGSGLLGLGLVRRRVRKN